MKSFKKYKVTIVLLTVGMLFWARLIWAYIGRLFSGSADVYTLIAVLLVVDMLCYCALAVGLGFDIKWARVLIMPFVIANAVLSITDDVGFWDIASLVLNLVIIPVFLLERRRARRGGED